MKILFYDTKKYDKESFDKVLPKYEDMVIHFVLLFEYSDMYN